MWRGWEAMHRDASERTYYYYSSCWLTEGEDDREGYDGKGRSRFNSIAWVCSGAFCIYAHTISPPCQFRIGWHQGDLLYDIWGKDGH